MAFSSFRVIIVGGGPIGLTAAHMLARADIDFVVLERGPSIRTDRGASLAMLPPTIRIFDQLGLYDALCTASCQVDSSTLVTHDGKQYDRQFFPVETHHGHAGRICPRAGILDILFTHLPEYCKDRVYVNKKVVDMSITEDSATVSCQDGSAYTGSMILGVDGVHSAVRTLTRALALKESLDSTALYPEQPFVSTFQVIFGSVPRPEQFPPGEIYESHGIGTSTQLMNGKDQTWFFLYRRLTAETQQRTTYTEEDLNQGVKEMAHIYMTPELTVGDIYATKTAASMVDLQEGIMPRRYWRRVYLAGDSWCKMTPNAGFGFHNGVWDLAVLVNNLREELQTHPGIPISASAITEIFHSSQEERRGHTSSLSKISADLTRSSTWQTWPGYFLDRFLLPWTYSMSWLNLLMIAPLLKVCPVLGWLPEPHFKSGSVPWVHMPKPNTE